ncbi:hypothetical protein [Mycobacterium rhizamassiliense]|uniref:hypothetical protein n=1 Tax=Mycobacterium rhizamassiliense TaxID=1841860 RepID=UPI0012FF61F4|nr:hypothetical protein [Mycobacterium rhizamassiliense]
MGEPQRVVTWTQSKRAAAMWNWRLAMAASMPCRTAERTKQTRVGGQPRRVRRAAPGFRPRGELQQLPRVRRDRATRTSSGKYLAPQEVRDKTWNPRRRQLADMPTRPTARSSTR